jgi:hypothetical protein
MLKEGSKGMNSDHTIIFLLSELLINILCRGREFELLKILWKQSGLSRKIKESGLLELNIPSMFFHPS